jgi:hypothetical protein
MEKFKPGKLGMISQKAKNFTDEGVRLNKS